MKFENYTIREGVLSEKYLLRFLSRIRINTHTECWEWTGAPDANGYGRITIGGGNGKPWYAHILSYRLFLGEVPEGLQLDHTCRVRHCVNPKHLEPVTHKVNSLRGVGWCAQRARSTSCVNGHDFTPENTWVRSDGTRTCIECRKIRLRAWYARKTGKLAS